MSTLYDFEALTIEGKPQSLKAYQGKVVVVVNTASQCGLTPQYKGLQELYDKYHAQGLEILGFPCNQFGGQEPGSEKEIATFCETSFGVSFPMFGKIDVNGADTHPLYKWMKDEKPGLLGLKDIKWNFGKFLINREGEVVERFAPTTAPADMSADIEKLLKV